MKSSEITIVLFDGAGHKNLQPLTLTRPVAHIRVGICTLQEKWEHYLNQECQVRTKDYLSKKFSSVDSRAEIGIAGGLLPTEDLADTILELKDNEILMKNGEVLAIRPLPAVDENMEKVLKGSTLLEYDLDVDFIRKPWDIFTFNGTEIEKDFDWITAERTSAEIHESNTLIGDRIFVEEGAKVWASTLNSTSGAIYIGADAEMMEGCMVRGGLALCEHATLKMGTKIYGPTTIGPHSKVGGEVSNSVMIGYSNKGHDGFLGNSVLGEWCNLGADTNTSNLKNNYSEVKVWSFVEDDFVPTGLQFCGLLMGDHSKSSINTMFNTGTVVGVCANIFDAGFPPKYVPSFSWGGKEGIVKFQLEKAFEVATRVMERRGISLTDEDKEILAYIAGN